MKLQREPLSPIINFKILDLGLMLNNAYDQLKNKFQQKNLYVETLIGEQIEENISLNTHESDRAKDFLITLIFWLLGYQFLLGLFIEYQSIFKNENFLDILNPMMMILVGVGSIVRVYSNDYPASSYGLNLNNWIYNLKESLLWTTYFIVGLIIFKIFLTQFISYYQSKPIFDFSSMNRLSTEKLILTYAVYFCFAPIQEFAARGVIQGSLEKYLTGKNRIAFSILLSNLLFGAFHIHYDIKFAVMTVVVGIFWGVMYARQKSLLGVSVSHAIIGLFTFLCMGFL